MTGLVLKSLKLDLTKVKKLLEESSPEKSPIPPSRTRKFLPGETRATCGPDGFRDLQPATAELYRRKIYSDPNERNLTPPRYTAPINIGDDSYSPYQLQNMHQTGLVKTTRQCFAEDYILRLHEHLHCASYRMWSINGWTWRQETHQVHPEVISL